MVWNRRLLWVCLGALMLWPLAVTGCGSKAPREPGRYYDGKRGISIRFPGGWEVMERDDVDAVSAAAPFESDLDMLREAISISVQDLPSQMPLEEFSEVLLEGAREDTLEFTEQAHGEATIDGAAATWTAFTFTDEDGTWTILGYALVREGNGYMITCLCEPHTYAQYLPIFEESVMSLRFE